jgi:hypothetical protein
MSTARETLAPRISQETLVDLMRIRAAAGYGAAHHEGVVDLTHAAGGRTPRGIVGTLAALVSGILSPPMVVVAAALLCYRADPQPATLVWILLFVALAALLPCLFLLEQRRRGNVASLWLDERSQRWRPLLFTAASTGLAWLILSMGHSSLLLYSVATAYWLQSFLLLAISLRWRISVQTSGAAGLGILAWAILGTPWLGVALVSAAAWSRLQLRRHSAAQILAGAALGAGTMLFALLST